MEISTDLIYEIVTRMPTKELITFRNTCKNLAGKIKGFEIEERYWRDKLRNLYSVHFYRHEVPPVTSLTLILKILFKIIDNDEILANYSDCSFDSVVLRNSSIFQNFEGVKENIKRELMKMSPQKRWNVTRKIKNLPEEFRNYIQILIRDYFKVIAPKFKLDFDAFI